MQEPKRQSSGLERIAELAGVSRSTVSRVLNNDPNVKDSTRDRVLATVEQERFVPNRAARGLAMGRTGMIGIVMSVDFGNFFSDPFFGALLQATYDAARQHELVLSLWMPDGPNDRNTIDQVTSGSMLDGVVMAAENAHDPIVHALSESQKPFVLLGRSATHTDVSFVDVDNRGAAREATAHLAGLGRTRIATIAGPEFSVAGTDRLDGYHDALADAGLPADPALVADGGFTAHGAADAVRAILPAKPDAIFAASDVMAIAAMTELESQGLRVPEDVAVVGFDDLPAARELTPPLTTVRQSVPLLASEALNMLTARIADPAAAKMSKLNPTELIVRESCGASL